MNENDSTGGKWGQNIALFLIVAVLVVLFAIWMCNKTGQDKADLAASVQKLYGQVDCLAAQSNKYNDRVDAIGVALAKTSQAQGDFQDYVMSYLPQRKSCGCNGGNGCGQSKFVKSTEYTAGAVTLLETDTCCS